MIYMTTTFLFFFFCLAGLTVSTPTPPAVPLSTAKTLLANLTVAARGPITGYSRALFPQWIEIENGCNTRQEVLKRDGMDVVTGTDCKITSGTWVSPYDGKVIKNSTAVQIDHLVPLALAWTCGASSWTTARRTAFANELALPELVAVSATANDAKGDSGPDEWQPPLVSYHCTYAEMYIAVKYSYELTVTEPEKEALTQMLGTC